jgi:hypothetical protein
MKVRWPSTGAEAKEIIRSWTGHRTAVVAFVLGGFLWGPVADNTWADDEVADILRRVERTPAAAPSPTPRASPNAVSTPRPRASPTARPRTQARRNDPPAKMPDERLEIGDRVRGPFLVTQVSPRPNGRYLVSLSTKHPSKGRMFVVDADRPPRVGDSFNSGVLIGRFLGMLTLVPYD